MHPLFRFAANAVPAACLAACTPALDWRDVRPADTALQLQFPCKPIAQQRQVVLAGGPVRLALSACTTDGQTWGLADADVADPARVTPALLQLRAAAAANLAQSVADVAPGARVAMNTANGASGPAAAAAVVRVPGSTPNPASQRHRLVGSLPDGTPVQMQLVVFAHGTRVFQATVLGSELSQTAADNYFASMAIRP